VIEELVPTWRAFPGVIAVRVSFVEERDEGAPDLALILAVDYPDRRRWTMPSPATRAGQPCRHERTLPRFFSGRIHHHVTELLTFQPE